MRDLSGLLAQEAVSLVAEEPFAWLGEVELPTVPATRFRVTTARSDVSFGEQADGDPVVYKPFPMLVGAIQADINGDLPRVQLVVDPADGLIASYIEDYDGLSGQPVDLRLVNLGELDNFDSQVLFHGEVLSVDLAATGVTFNIGAPNIKRYKFPRNRYSRTSCRWIFGSEGCAYSFLTTGASFVAGDCSRVRAFCKRVGEDETANGLAPKHPLRFGGFPGLAPR